MTSIRDKKRSVSDAEWEIWYQDTFDRDCPRRVEIAGRGLVEGLLELWARLLFETVQADGGRGFSRFNLWWKQAKTSIEIEGEWDGLVRLREWVYGSKWRSTKGYAEEGDLELLKNLAAAHKHLILRGATSERILAVAKTSENHADFEAHLFKMKE